MKKLEQARKNGSIIYIACAAMVWLCWQLGQYVNAQLTKIEPRALQQFVSKPAAPQQITFTPYQSAAAHAERQADDAESVDFDEVFRAKEEPKVDLVQEGVVQAPKEPRYSDLIRQKISIESLADNGAVLNGRFTPTGQAVEQLAVASPAGQLVTPTLIAVSRNGVTLSIAKEMIEVKVADGGGFQ